MQDCFDSHHNFLPVNCAIGDAAFAPRETLCLTCLTNRFDALSPNLAARALQVAAALLQESLSPDSHMCVTLLPHWGDFVRLAATLCAAAALPRHAPLLRAAKTFLGVLFAAPRGPSEKWAAALVGEMCAAVRNALAATDADGKDSPAGLLLLSDLADVSGGFLRAMAAYGAAACCAMLEPLRDAYRVELALYLLHQLFAACVSCPEWLERLAAALAAAAVLDRLAWVLESFPNDEPVVVNALCLTRAVLTYETTRVPLLQFAETLSPSTPTCMTRTHRCACGVAWDGLLRLLRGLAPLLLYPNADLIVAAADALRALALATPPSASEACADVVDYVLESLRTPNTADVAMSVVSLLNALPPPLVPAGPTLRVLFDLPSMSSAAYEAAVRGPHFHNAVQDRLTNLNETAHQMARAALAGASLECFLLQLHSLESACVGCCAAIRPEATAALTNALLHCLAEVCGRDNDSPHNPNSPSHHNYHSKKNIGRVEWPFNERLAVLSREALLALTRAVSFLLPSALDVLRILRTDLLAMALQRPAEWWGRAADAEALLLLAADALERDAADDWKGTLPTPPPDPTRTQDDDGGGGGGSALAVAPLRCLLRADLFGFLMRLPSAPPTWRVRVTQLLLHRVDCGGADGADGVAATLLDGAFSPRAVVEVVLCHRPRHAAALLLALAVSGCPAPLDAAERGAVLRALLDALLDGQAAAALAVLRASLACHMWGGPLPEWHTTGALTQWAAGVGVSREVQWDLYKLFHLARRGWVDALAKCSWGVVLLSLMLAAAVMHYVTESISEKASNDDVAEGTIVRRDIITTKKIDTEGEKLNDALNAEEEVEARREAEMENEKEEEGDSGKGDTTPMTASCGDCFPLFHASSPPCGSFMEADTSAPRGVGDALRGLVVSHAFHCGVALTRLFATLRQPDERGLGSLVARFLCYCVADPAAVPFACHLLEQHLTPALLLLLTREHVGSAAPIGDIARLVVLTLAPLPPNAASGCDHTLFKWVLHRLARHAQPPHHSKRGSQSDAVGGADGTVRCVVYAWQALLLLLERVHGAEFALRHESELLARLSHFCAGERPVLPALRWAVESAMRRRGGLRGRPPLWRAAPFPLLAIQSARGGVRMALEAFVVCAAARDGEDAALLDAAPALLEWAVALLGTAFAAQTSASPLAYAHAARLAFTLLRARPGLAASLEALALFLQLPPASARVGCTAAALGCQAWLLAAFIAVWPPWAEAAGLAATTRAFLAALQPPDEATRVRDDTRRALGELVEVCETHAARCGQMPLSRAKDFFLRTSTGGMKEMHDGGEGSVRGFAAVYEGCELFLPFMEEKYIT